MPLLSPFSAILTKKLKRERRNARRLQDQIDNVGMRQQPLPQSAQAHPQHAAISETSPTSGEDSCIKQTQEDLKKLNAASSFCDVDVAGNGKMRNGVERGIGARTLHRDLDALDAYKVRESQPWDVICWRLSE
ncbi:hypothetical protein LSH36_191g01056 [Paralvinella palmiformis]|uniref:Uncharacterized protein n=1 Tax=Paralvinella palmiformis TaxID=53620 RepID=A0AAD9JRS9_9ANNE|nr:hypothetical protein LSH36_191g01056 [Paralvinella palmiformis]